MGSYGECASLVERTWSQSRLGAGAFVHRCMNRDVRSNPGSYGSISVATLGPYYLGGWTGAGLNSSTPMVAGNTRASSSTVHVPSLWMVLTGSGSFIKLTNPSVT